MKISPVVILKNPSVSKLIPVMLILGYWVYLWFTSNPLLAHDAIDYEHLGKMIAYNGWMEYFQTGPKREPLYPLLVAFSLKLGDLLSFNYQKILIIFQFLILFTTIILTTKILKILSIKQWLINLTTLYIGFSPALLNSSLSIYSEILTYPFILSAIILSYKSTHISSKHSSQTHILKGISLGAIFVLITLQRAVFELITPLYLIFLTIILLKLKPNNSKTIISFLISIVVVFYSGILCYKYLNYKHNENFVITNRGSWALYGNTTRRMQPMDTTKILAAIAYVPGEGVCHKFFDTKTCDFWSFKESDSYGYSKLSELTQKNLSKKEINSKLVKESMQKALSNPLQYAFFTTLEGIKMFFWESTQIGFVKYPEWLTKLYNFTPFKDGLRLLMSFFSIGSFIYALHFVWKDKLNAQNATLTLIISLTIFYITLYSFFFILTRYSLPIAPLYLILIAFTLNQILSKNLSK